MAADTVTERVVLLVAFSGSQNYAVRTDPPPSSFLQSHQTAVRCAPSVVTLTRPVSRAHANNAVRVTLRYGIPVAFVQARGEDLPRRLSADNYVPSVNFLNPKATGIAFRSNPFD